MKKPNSRHANSPVRQKQIIQAALACFSEKGFTETSISDICQRANASTGSVYHHFKSKEKLAAAVYLEGIQDYQTGLMDTLEKQKHARDGIHEVVHYHLKWVENNPDWSGFLFQKRYAEFMGGTEDDMNQLNMEFMRRVSKWFKKHIEAGTLKPLPGDIFISILLGPCQEYVRLYTSGNASSSVEKAANDIASAAWRALGNEG